MQNSTGFGGKGKEWYAVLICSIDLQCMERKKWNLLMELKKKEQGDMIWVVQWYEM